MSKHWNPTTISLHEDLIKKLDELRHDIPRSRYISRIVEEHLRLMESSA